MKPRPRPNADFTVIAVPAEVFCTRLRPRRRVLADESVSMPPWTAAFARWAFRRIGVEATVGVQSHQDLRRMVPELLCETNGIVAGVEDEKRWLTPRLYVLGKSMEKILDLYGGDFRCVLSRRQPASIHRCDPTVSGEAESSYPLVGPACDDGLSRGTPARMVVETAFGTALRRQVGPSTRVHGIHWGLSSLATVEGCIRRSRRLSASIFPLLSAAHRLPQRRRCTAVRLRCTGEETPASVVSIASVSSKWAPARRPRHP
jgi:hypothetical protein